MATGAKILLIVVGGSILLMAATVAAGAAAIYSGGTIAVDVAEESGGGISVHVPAAIAHLALAMVPDRVIEEALEDVSDELEPYLPALQNCWTEFERAPDFVMVEVESRQEHVRVEKRNGKLLVLIENGGDDIRVEVPLKTLRRFVRKF